MPSIRRNAIKILFTMVFCFLSVMIFGQPDAKYDLLHNFYIKSGVTVNYDYSLAVADKETNDVLNFSVS